MTRLSVFVLGLVTTLAEAWGRPRPSIVGWFGTASVGRAAMGKLRAAHWQGLTPVDSKRGGTVGAHVQKTVHTPGTQERVKFAGAAKCPAGSAGVDHPPAVAAQRSPPRRPASSGVPARATKESHRTAAATC